MDLRNLNPSTKEDRTLAKPNYQFEKRRKDLEKKAKKEEKRLRKAAEKANPSAATEEDKPAE